MLKFGFKKNKRSLDIFSSGRVGERKLFKAWLFLKDAPCISIIRKFNQSHRLGGGVWDIETGQ